MARIECCDQVCFHHGVPSAGIDHDRLRIEPHEHVVINQVIRLRRLGQHADQVIKTFHKGQSVCTRVAGGKALHGAAIGVESNHL